MHKNKQLAYIAFFILTIVLSNFRGSRLSETLIEKPNILFIFTDDQRADALGCAGNPVIKTPNIDELAKTGTRFENCYVMGGHHGAICAPSRAMLMTGKSLFHVYDKLAGETTMPMYLRKFGYESFATGKWHNEVSSFEESFDKGKNVMTQGMSDHFTVPIKELGADGKLTEPEKKGFSTDLFADAAIDYLNAYGKGTRQDPFFCYVSFSAPHDPRSPHKDYIGMYTEESIPLPENYLELHPFAFDNMNIRDETLTPWPRTPEIIKASIADYYALISHIDSRIGDIIQTLKDQNLYKNTIIIYAADNGLAIGSHGLLGKQNLYEHSTNVPLIMTGPGISANQTKDALIYLYDIYPTLTEHLELALPVDIDGESFASLLKDQEMQTRKSLYTVYRNTVRAVRTEEWKLIKYPQREYVQLFNLRNDPAEINNLVDESQYQSKVTELSKLMEEWYNKVDDTADMDPETILPLEYDFTKLKQTPDRHQPAYTLKKYFEGIE